MSTLSLRVYFWCSLVSPERDIYLEYQILIYGYVVLIIQQSIILSGNSKMSNFVIIPLNPDGYCGSDSNKDDFSKWVSPEMVLALLVSFP